MDWTYFHETGTSERKRASPHAVPDFWPRGHWVNSRSLVTEQLSEGRLALGWVLWKSSSFLADVYFFGHFVSILYILCCGGLLEGLCTCYLFVPAVSVDWVAWSPRITPWSSVCWGLNREPPLWCARVLSLCCAPSLTLPCFASLLAKSDHSLVNLSTLQGSLRANSLLNDFLTPKMEEMVFFCLVLVVSLLSEH